MSGEEEVRKKARQDVEQVYTYTRRGKRAAQRMPRKSVTPEASSSDSEQSQDQYVIQQRAREKGKGVAHGSQSHDAGGEDDGDDNDDDDDMEEDEEFDVEEVQPQGNRRYGSLLMREPQNPGWRAPMSYKNRTDLVRQQKLVDPRQAPREASDYRFHNFFQQDFYWSAIYKKKKAQIAEAQWIDFTHMAAKKNPVFNEVIAACEVKNVKRIMSFQKDWCNEVIAQFYATLYVEEIENARNMHWMTEGQWFHVSYEQFARTLGFGRLDANRVRLHLANPLKTERMKHLYPRGMEGYAGTTINMLPFFAYLNRMFRKTIAPREGDATNISVYAKNLLAAMDSGFPPFSVFDFIWEEIKFISRTPARSCAYAPYIMHMIEKVTGGTFECEVKHLPLKMKANLPDPTAGSGRTAAGPSSSAPRTPRGTGQQREKSTSPVRKMLNAIFGMCKCIATKQHHERQARKKDTKTIKMLAQERNIPRSPIGSENEESELEDYEAMFPQFQEANPFGAYYMAEDMAAAMRGGPPPFDTGAAQFGRDDAGSSQQPLNPHQDEEEEESDESE